MNWRTKKAGEPQMEGMDAELKQALGDFKASVHAWSDAEFAKPRAVHASATHHGLKLALGWSLAGVLLAAGSTGVVYMAYDRQPDHEAANQQKAAPMPAAPAQQMPAQQAAHVPDEARKHEMAVHRASVQVPQEDLLASVDTAVSRTVPRAMEPLMYMSNDTGTDK